MSQQMTIADLYRRVGPLKFWTGSAAFVLWLGAGFWLLHSARLAAMCPIKFRGRGIIAFAEVLMCSPRLLDGQAADVGAFLWIWSIPAAICVLVLWAYFYVKRLSAASTHSDRME